MGGKGKTALRSALDQTTHCRVKITYVNDIALVGARNIHKHSGEGKIKTTLDKTDWSHY